MWRILLMLAGCIPMAVLLAFVLVDRWRRKRAGERPPQHEKLLRPAGHSLNLRLADMGDDFSSWMIGAFLASLASVGAVSFNLSNYSPSQLVSWIVFSLCAAICTVMAWRTGGKIRSNRLGLLGEQSVAEQLQTLLSQGYRVFHDIPGDGQWNVDHAAVGPAGVFAIETKARTKRPGKAGERDHEAEFDGKAIRFPSGYDAEATEQARRNAKWLANMLSKSTGERVTVQPIVALPGWWVTRTASSDVKVLSGKEVPGFIAAEPSKLPAKVIQQIAYQLEQRCRDVEF